MADINVPEDVTIEDFFNKYVPEQFGAEIENTDLSFLEGKEFTLQFDIDGKKYCIRVKDGKDFEVVEGGVDKPMLELRLGEDFWRKAVTGKVEGALDQFTDPGQMADANRYNNLAATKGKLDVELSMEDGSTEKVTLVFNGEENPEVTLKLSMGDWVSMQRKETDGQTLFMSGKMQFAGDTMFLMSLNNLM